MLTHTFLKIDQDVVAESWEEHVQRKLQWAIPDEGAWGEANNYELFVKVGWRFMIPPMSFESAGRSGHHLKHSEDPKGDA